MPTILITGFGPFPGAPYNPTIRLVERLVKLRRPALADVRIVGHVFETSYAAVDRDLPALLERHKPDALLMFGLAARTKYIRIETRARNALALLPDVSGAVLRRSVIAPGGPLDRMMPAPHRRLLAAARAAGVPVKLSRDAGRYLVQLSFAGAPAKPAGRGWRRSCMCLWCDGPIPFVPAKAGQSRKTGFPLSRERAESYYRDCSRSAAACWSKWPRQFAVPLTGLNLSAGTMPPCRSTAAICCSDRSRLCSRSRRARRRKRSRKVSTPRSSACAPTPAATRRKQLQRAIDAAAQADKPLWLPAGTYRSGPLTLRAGSRLQGARGATIALTRGPSLFAAQDADSIALGGSDARRQRHRARPRRRPDRRLTGARGLRIADCTVTNANGNAIGLFKCGGAVTDNTITNSADNALYALDSNALDIRGNTISKSGNGGIRIWQSAKRHDGSVVADNTIEDTEARGGGDGQNGNAVNVFRAEGVIVRGNTIRRAAFTAVRGNAASHIQILGNQCFALGEVAIYSEFDFINATIADNLVDGAALGVAVTNFDVGGRGAVVRNNIIRNIVNKRPQGGPDSSGLGIGVEADTLVTGNTIENAPDDGHRGRQRQVSAQLHRHRQHRAQDRHRHRRLGGRGRGRGDDHRQPHHRREARRRCRHGMGQARHRRSGPGRRRAVSEVAGEREQDE